MDVIYSAPEITSIGDRGGQDDDNVIGVLEGDSLTLRCHSTGVPPPEVNWVRRPEGEAESSTIRASASGVLQLDSVSRSEDEGRYACVAANEYGSDSSEAEVAVYKRMRFRGRLNLMI